MNVCECKLIFPPDTLQQKIEIADLKHILAAENTSVLIIFGHHCIYEGCVQLNMMCKKGVQIETSRRKKYQINNHKK